MVMKYVFWTALLLVAAGLVTGTYYLSRPRKPVVIEQVTRQVTQPTVTTVIRERMPAVVETLWVQGEPHEIATWAAIIDTNRVHLDMVVWYDTHEQVFDLVKLNAVGLVDSVYVSGPAVVKEVERKRKFLGVTGALGIGWAKADPLDEGADPRRPVNAVVDAGVVIKESWRLTCCGDSQGQFGMSLGVDL